MKQIELSGKKGKGLFALVDDEDYPILSRIKWNITNGYAVWKNVYMHHMVIGSRNSNYIPDHINRNKLDNRKKNIRFVTVQQNLMNSSKRKGKGVTSIYKGVSLRREKSVRPWKACLSKTVNKKSVYHHIGYFDSEIKAAIAYDIKAKEIFGEYAAPNFPETVQ